MKKEKYDLLATQEMIEKLQQDEPKHRNPNWKEVLLLLGISGAIILLSVSLIWIGT